MPAARKVLASPTNARTAPYSSAPIATPPATPMGGRRAAPKKRSEEVTWKTPLTPESSVSPPPTRGQRSQAGSASPTRVNTQSHTKRPNEEQALPRFQTQAINAPFFRPPIQVPQLNPPQLLQPAYSGPSDEVIQALLAMPPIPFHLSTNPIHDQAYDLVLRVIANPPEGGVFSVLDLTNPYIHSAYIHFQSTCNPPALDDQPSPWRQSATMTNRNPADTMNMTEVAYKGAPSFATQFPEARYPY